MRYPKSRVMVTCVLSGYKRLLGILFNYKLFSRFAMRADKFSRKLYRAKQQKPCRQSPHPKDSHEGGALNPEKHMVFNQSFPSVNKPVAALSVVEYCKFRLGCMPTEARYKAYRTILGSE